MAHHQTATHLRRLPGRCIYADDETLPNSSFVSTWRAVDGSEPKAMLAFPFAAAYTWTHVVLPAAPTKDPTKRLKIRASRLKSLRNSPATGTISVKSDRE
jgi:hypothetical protein